MSSEPPPELTNAEIIRRVRNVRFSPAIERYRKTIPGINTIAVAAGLTRRTIHRIAEGRVLSPSTMRAVGQALLATGIGK